MGNKVYEVRKTILPTGDFSKKTVRARNPREAIELVDENGGRDLSYRYFQEDCCTATGRHRIYGAECILSVVSNQTQEAGIETGISARAKR